MNLLCRCMLITWWIKVGLMPGVFSHLSKEDVLLLKNEESPKCFTHTQKDFTCFFETRDNNIYDFFYQSGRRPKKRCELSVQRTEDGDFLHICNFPGNYIYLFINTYIEVVDCTTNKSLYRRNVSVEDHCLLDPPFNVSLHPNVHAGELQVSWQTKKLPYLDKTYKIRYASKTHRDQTEEVMSESSDLKLSLTPGEKVEVQVAVKTSQFGHWSSWSQPARGAVPQRADDIALICYTPDLQYVTCCWDSHRYKKENADEEKEYKLFYKLDLGEKDEWTECLDDGTSNDMCCFHGSKSRQIRVKLSCTSPSISRTFFTDEFQLNKSIKTSPPGHLQRVQRNNELCLDWETPFPSLSDHLEYEVHFLIKGGKQWKINTGPETNTCAKVSGDHYTVKIRAKPTGFIYSGHWSDWSNVLTVYTTPDIGLFPVWCYTLIPMFLITIAFIGFFCLCYSRIKEYVWPPVPNLQEVLQGYLTEISKSKWDPPVAGKQCFEEGRPSVVEILSEAENPGLVKPSEESTDLLSSTESFSSGEQTDGSPDVFPDYVTLNKDTVVLCLLGNSYVSELIIDNGAPEAGNGPVQRCQYSCNDGSTLLKSCLGNEMVNYSYLPMVEPADGEKCKNCNKSGLGNIYTNLSNN